MRDGSSVAVDLARWRGAFVIGFLALFLIKLMLAVTLSPFGDEAFYWQESRHLAWGYSDLPPLTAWLIRFGEAVAGHGLLGMRWPFLLIGSALPWLVWAFARYVFDERAGWQAGLLCLALPLAGSLGVLALPDVPLTVATMLALLALVRAMDDDRLHDWWLLGVALAIAWLTHYRAAMPMLAGLLFCVLTARGRRQWRRGGFWLALGVAALGLLPLLISNWQQHGAGLAFQLLERHPWTFHADALVQPLEQAIACTPLLYALLLWAVWQCWKRNRQEGAPWDVIATVSLSFIVLYFVLGLFADDRRFRAHWPLAGYLPLLAALPVLLRHEVLARRRSWLVVTFGLAVLGQLGGLFYLGLAASPEGARVLAGVKAFPASFVGWRESGDAAGELLSQHPAVLVADHAGMAVEIAFRLGDRVPVYTLDSPLNVKHGRAPQLAIWQRDETALRNAHAGEPMLLVVDEAALLVHERPAWLRTLCSRIDEPRLLRRLDLFDGRRRFAFYLGRVPTAVPVLAQSDDQCSIWQFAHKAER
ncbi:glycosyltransferase family 39 protein [Dyella halodurans]|uniref:ArnT family glycosyltransferase n=1 Tax=Dyella halodurans TaxID=1920171 RepID=A0ABV9C1C4_9GAMM|nr:glycosyltransferase family 39 protein [Dyella halodurans]